VINVIVLH